MDDELMTFRALFEAGEDAENTQPCTQCGQVLDLRDLTQVLHHHKPDHAPLP